MKRLLLLAGALWLVCAAAFAAPDIKCIGQVVDEQDEPVIGATVTAVGTKIATSTNIDGQFDLLVPSSVKTLKISFIGYKTTEVPAAANVGTIKLETESMMLNDVVISQSVGKTRETPVAMSTINAEQIEFKLGNQELLEVLKTTPGVYTRSEGGGFGDAKTRVRGFESQ
ncbi:MAG: carboxypeptidase-like regulatory domain-containing protein, partial [Muribaculaceae bacterium]|nr:carboxypeptidase-like regulatory domain-containing protein [Muribaculaceae bacterium]